MTSVLLQIKVNTLPILKKFSYGNKKRKFSKVMVIPKAAIPSKVVILCSDTSLQRLSFGNNHVFFYGPVEYIHNCLHLSTTAALAPVLKMAVMEDLTTLCLKIRFK